MKVLHIKIRLSEGGAARVARELHTGLSRFGIQSSYAYGYSRRGKVSPIESEIGSAFRISNPIQSAANRVVHRIIGVDFFKPFGIGEASLVNAIDNSDIVHLHAIHSHYAPYSWLIERLEDSKKPIIWTAHDHWMVTGRCAFTDNCVAWKDECGKCKTKDNYPPVLVDISYGERRRKKKIIERLADQLIVVSPSQHLALDIKSVYPLLRMVQIPNSIDKEFEDLLTVEGSGKTLDLHTERPRILVIANDLDYDGKTSKKYINTLISSDTCDVVTVGRNSPFLGNNVTNLGEIRSRYELLNIYRSCNALLFTSKVDNFPLVLCEAQAAGLPIIALESPAANELLGLVGGRCMSEGEINCAISNRDYFSQYSNIFNRLDLREAALKVFGHESMLRKYMDLYIRAFEGK